MNLDQLRCFIAVVEEGGFSRAAARMHVSTSVVSRRIKDLERQLRTPLLVRTSSGALLTKTGTAFVEPCRQALASIEALRDVGRWSGEAASGFRVGVSIAVPPRVVSACLDSLRDVVGGKAVVTVEPASSATVMAAVRALDVDVAVVYLPPTEPGLEMAPIGQPRFQIAVAAGDVLASRSSVALRDLEGYSFALLPRDRHPIVVNALAQRLRLLGVQPVVPAADSTEATVWRVRTGEWITLVAHRLYGGRALMYDVEGTVLVDLDDDVPELTLGLVWHPEAEAARQVPFIIRALAARWDDTLQGVSPSDR